MLQYKINEKLLFLATMEDDFCVPKVCQSTDVFDGVVETLN
jgi:hypothetical protein